jgi:DEAD/DEAH box helicase domain-containing protein
VALASKGIDRLYSHQRAAYDLLASGKNVCVVTPTASGKTLCYNLPVLDSALKDPDARSLYIFPTKGWLRTSWQRSWICPSAVSSRSKLHLRWGHAGPQAAAGQGMGQVIITNHDMSTRRSSPHHPTWVKLFSGLKYVVVDEMTATGASLEATCLTCCAASGG